MTTGLRFDRSISLGNLVTWGSIMLAAIGTYYTSHYALKIEQDRNAQRIDMLVDIVSDLKKSDGATEEWKRLQERESREYRQSNETRRSELVQQYDRRVTTLEVTIQQTIPMLTTKMDSFERKLDGITRLLAPARIVTPRL